MDIYINKLTLIGTEENIDTFLQEQVVDGRMSFGFILPMPEDLIQTESSYETEFIYSDYDNALIFNRTDSGFSYKHVNANIYAYYNDNPKHDWLASNWQSTFDISSQELIINRHEGFVDILFSTRYSYPFTWYFELSKKYNNLVCEMEIMSYDYRYVKLTIVNDSVNFERENMPFYYQFDSMKLVEDENLTPMEALGND
jgi:hypothetical protein